MVWQRKYHFDSIQFSIELGNVDAGDLKEAVESEEQIEEYFERINCKPGPALHNAATLF